MGESPQAGRPELVAFGGRIRARRAVLGLSQEALADRCELHWTYVGQIERGRRNVSLLNILRLAKALEVDASELLVGLPRSPV
ncbi:MAG TPA: helix-turn-helix transcriptional regulator [Acidimicrobiales bacterium]|nr:helix-turn-helix transcriptional regulator [Acidimicrobiales bacterium]